MKGKYCIIALCMGFLVSSGAEALALTGEVKEALPAVLPDMPASAQQEASLAAQPALPAAKIEEEANLQPASPPKTDRAETAPTPHTETPVTLSEFIGQRIAIALDEHTASRGNDPTPQARRVMVRMNQRDLNGEMVDSSQTDIHELVINKKNRSFSVSLQVEGKLIPLMGRYEEFIRVPALKNRLQAGDTIQQNDLAMTEVSSTRIRRDTVINMAELVGKPVRRSVMANAPINASELAVPVAVARNRMVTMVYQDQAFTLKTLGVALDSGGVGEVIRVKNAKSNQVIQATIEDKDLVKVVSLK